MKTQKFIEDVVARRLESVSFEELLEEFDITPEECTWILFKLGYISIDILENLKEVDISE